VILPALLLALAAPAHGGGLIDAYGGEAEAHYALCRHTEEEAGDDLSRVVGVWKACLGEAERREFASILPAVRGSLTLASALYDAARLEDSSEAERLELVLTSVARQRDVHFRLESLGGLYRRYLVTDRGRSRMTPYRYVTFRWTNQAALDAEGLGQVNSIVRRYVEDAGFRWAEYGTEAGSQADVLCKGTVRARVMESTGEQVRQLPMVEAVFAIESARISRDETSIQGFLSTGQATATTEDAALEASLHPAAQAMAATLLHRVIQVAFAGAVDLQDYLDPDADVY